MDRENNLMDAFAKTWTRPTPFDGGEVVPPTPVVLLPTRPDSNKCRVRVKGIVSRPHLNGQLGLAEYKPDRERYAVRLDSGVSVLLRADALCAAPSLEESKALGALHAIVEHGWEKAADLVRRHLDAFAPCLTYAVLQLPGAILAGWRASRPQDHGTHSWALAVLASILQLDASLRGCDSPFGVPRAWRSQRTVQALYERAWAAGYGDGTYFGGSIAGKHGERSHTGPADMCEALLFSGVESGTIDFLCRGPDGGAIAHAASGGLIRRDMATAAINVIVAVAEQAKENGMPMPPLLLQTGGGSPLHVLIGVVEDSDGFVFLETDESGAVYWFDAHTYFDKHLSPIQLLVTRPSPSMDEALRNSLFAASRGVVRPVAFWLEGQWEIPDRVHVWGHDLIRRACGRLDHGPPTCPRSWVSTRFGGGSSPQKPLHHLASLMKSMQLPPQSHAATGAGSDAPTGSKPTDAAAASAQSAARHVDDLASIETPPPSQEDIEAAAARAEVFARELIEEEEAEKARKSKQRRKGKAKKRRAGEPKESAEESAPATMIPAAVAAADEGWREHAEAEQENQPPEQPSAMREDTDLDELRRTDGGPAAPGSPAEDAAVEMEFPDEAAHAELSLTAGAPAAKDATEVWPLSEHPSSASVLAEAALDVCRLDVSDTDVVGIAAPEGASVPAAAALADDDLGSLATALSPMEAEAGAEALHMPPWTAADQDDASNEGSAARPYPACSQLPSCGTSWQEATALDHSARRSRHPPGLHSQPSDSHARETPSACHRQDRIARAPPGRHRTGSASASGRQDSATTPPSHQQHKRQPRERSARSAAAEPTSAASADQGCGTRRHAADRVGYATVSAHAVPGAVMGQTCPSASVAPLVQHLADDEDMDAPLVCPISHSIFKDPVSTVDGFTYERAAIEFWLANHSTSPITGLKLESTLLIPNHAIRQLVAQRAERVKSRATGADEGHSGARVPPADSGGWGAYSILSEDVDSTPLR